MFEKLDKLRAEVERRKKKIEEDKLKLKQAEENLEKAENEQILADVGALNLKPEQEVQEWFYEYHRANKGIRPTQIKALKELQNIDNITKYTFTATMNGTVPNKYGGGVTLSERKLNAFFRPGWPPKSVSVSSIELLTKWKEEQK